MTLPRGVGAVIITFLCVVFVVSAGRDYSEVVFKIGIGVAIYFIFLMLVPAAARLWLCLGGALVGALNFAIVGFLMIGIFGAGWIGFGLMIWGARFGAILPGIALVGGVTGFWLVYRWTEPPKSEVQLKE